MTFPLTLGQSLAAALVVALGATVQASVGLGLGIVAAPCLLLIDRDLVPGPLIAVGLVLTVLVAHRERHAIDRRGLAMALFGRLLGTVPAALALAVLTGPFFDAMFGGLVLMAVLLSLLGLRLAPRGWNIVLAGALSGFMGTASSIGGPPIALVYQHAHGARLRGTLASFFVFGAAGSLVALGVVGRFGAPEVLLALTLLPGVLTGFALSRRIAPVVDSSAVRPLVLGLSFAAAVVVLLRAVG